MVVTSGEPGPPDAVLARREGAGPLCDRRHPRPASTACRERIALIDADRAAASPRPSLEIYLGDFVDRGPRHERRARNPDGAEQVAGDVVLLRGNHEVLMQDFFDRKLPFDTWRRLGGAETLMSYGSPEFRKAARDRRSGHSIPWCRRSI